MRLHIATGVEDDEPEPFSHRGPPTTRRRDVRASNHQSPKFCQIP